ncbi:MAG: family 16 glycoside hydrolase [Planctomycetota bacterium]
MHPSFAPCFVVCLWFTATVAAESGTKVLLQDDFQREESQSTQDEIGNGWQTNSASRAAGNKQADLDDGALHIYRHAVADHGVSVTHEVAFKDATISMRFKIGPQDDLGINIADMNEKSVHAGHICVAQIRTGQLTIKDLKTGQMKLEIRAARQNKSMTPAQAQLVASRTKKQPIQLEPNQWHDLAVEIRGDTMSVSFNGQAAGSFTSPGIGHPTKSRLRLAVNRAAWVDDVRVVRHD